MQFRYALPHGDVTVQIKPDQQGYSITVLRPDREPVSYHVRARRPEHGRLNLAFGDRRERAHVAKEGDTRYVALGGHSWRLQPPQAVGRRAEVGGGGSLTASMPGKILDVLVEEGQAVEAGAPLVIMEAMKMELKIAAPGAGVVERIFVSAGELVSQGQELLALAEV